jgi:hypothetical protein
VLDSNIVASSVRLFVFSSESLNSITVLAIGRIFCVTCNDGSGADAIQIIKGEYFTYWGVAASIYNRQASQ